MPWHCGAPLFLRGGVRGAAVGARGSVLSPAGWALGAHLPLGFPRPRWAAAAAAGLLASLFGPWRCGPAGPRLANLSPSRSVAAAGGA